MKLTREQRKALFDGNPVKITFPGSRPCPIEEGHLEILSAHVYLEVTGIRRNRKGDWTLVYTLYNNRIGQRFLAAQDGQRIPPGHEWDPTDSEGHEGQYTHSGGFSVDHEAGEAVDDFTQRRITEAAKVKHRQDVGELLAAAEEIRAAVSERMDRPEFRAQAGWYVHRLKTELDALIENQRRKAA
jgi:hypothetical protein